MNIAKKKYELPLVARLAGIKFDISRLKSETLSLQEHWKSLFEANAGLCSVHPDLAEYNYRHFDQINLTTYQNATELLNLEQARIACKVLSESNRRQFGSIGAYRARTRQKNKIDPALDEHNWNVPMPFYVGSYVQEQIQRNFLAKAIRVRLTRLRAGKQITPHIDYCPTYAVRIIVPIETDPSVCNVFWTKGKRHSFNLPADGSAYFLNVAFRHAVENNSDKDRISLMFSLDSQIDLKLDDRGLQAN